MKKESKWYPYDPVNDKRMAKALAQVPSCFPELRDQIKRQIGGSEWPFETQNLPLHLFQTYNVNIFKMSWADMALIEQRIDYWTYAGGPYETIDPSGPSYEEVMALDKKGS